MIVGCVCMELYKVVQKLPTLASYKNAFINLAIPMLVFTEPSVAIKLRSKANDTAMNGPVQVIPEGRTKWEKVELQAPLLLEELIILVKERYNVSVTGVACGDITLYMEWLSPKEKLKMKLEDIIVAITSSKLSSIVQSLRIDELYCYLVSYA